MSLLIDAETIDGSTTVLRSPNVRMHYRGRDVTSMGCVVNVANADTFTGGVIIQCTNSSDPDTADADWATLVSSVALTTDGNYVISTTMAPYKFLRVKVTRSAGSADITVNNYIPQSY